MRRRVPLLLSILALLQGCGSTDAATPADAEYNPNVWTGYYKLTFTGEPELAFANPCTAINLGLPPGEANPADEGTAFFCCGNSRVAAAASEEPTTIVLSPDPAIHPTIDATYTLIGEAGVRFTWEDETGMTKVIGNRHPGCFGG